MTAILDKRWQHWMVLFCLTLLWFGTLQYRYLITPDEGRYAEIAREMLQTGDWLTPHLNGLKYFEKPPLQYWATACFFSIFGFSEFAARLWPALTGFLSALFIGFVARQLWNKEAGYVASGILISTIWWIGNSHFLTLDAGLSAFLAISMGSFLCAQHKDNKKIRDYWMLVSWAAAALAVLSKGLIGVVIPGCVLIIYSIWQKDWHLWRRLNLIKGLIVFGLITAPWFILVSLHNPHFAYFFFIQEHFARYATNVSCREGPIYYFVPLLIVGLTPWFSFLPRALSTISYRRTQQFSAEKFLLVWVAFIFLFFSLSSSKLPSYILPIFPALALLIARSLYLMQNKISRTHARLLCVPAAIMIVSAIIFYLLAAQSDRIVANQQFAIWMLIGGIVFAWCAWGAMSSAKKANTWLTILCFILAGLVAAQIPMLGHRVYGSQHTGYFLAQKIKPYLQPDMPLYIVSYYDQTLPFYLQRTIQLVNYHDEFTLGMMIEPKKEVSLAQFIVYWKNGQKAMAIMRESQYRQLFSQGIMMKKIIALDDKIVVVNQ